MAPAGVELIVGIVSATPTSAPSSPAAPAATPSSCSATSQSRLAPLGPRATRATMLRSLRTFPLLDGYRGAPRADVAAVEDVLLRVSALAAAHPEIAELDCNPLRVGPAGAVVLDARIAHAARRPRGRSPPSIADRSPGTEARIP